MSGAPGRLIWKSAAIRYAASQFEAESVSVFAWPVFPFSFRSLAARRVARRANPGSSRASMALEREDCGNEACALAIDLEKDRPSPFVTGDFLPSRSRPVKKPDTIEMKASGFSKSARRSQAPGLEPFEEKRDTRT